MSCWLFTEQVDYAVAKYYGNNLVMPAINKHIDVKKEKCTVGNYVHRAKRIGQAGSLTFAEWAETLAVLQKEN